MPDLAYRPSGVRPCDEAVDADGTPRTAYRGILDPLRALELDVLASTVAERLRAADVRFGAAGGEPFRVDPMPRVLGADEWARVEQGLAQRAAALDAFVADMHGARRCVADGVVPPDVLDGCPFYEAELERLPDPATARVVITGSDLVRGDDGELRVLEDNCRTPSGLGYALAAARATRGLHGDEGGVRDYEAELADVLRRALEAARPEDAPADGELVLLSDGPNNTAWWEHRTLADLIGVDLLVTDQLALEGDTLIRRDTGRPIAAAYRRTDVDRLRTPDGAPSSLGALLAGPLRAGRLGLLNWFGTGIADDKRVHAYVEDLERYYLRAEPQLRSVPTSDLSQGAALEEALDRAEELVFKPRDGYGGLGIVIGPAATPGELEELRATVRAAPQGWVAQPVVALSTHPTVVDGRLAPRHVDLRPFTIATGHRTWEVLPGGLTRVAFTEGDLIVNSSRGGGGKTTWVLR